MIHKGWKNGATVCSLALDLFAPFKHRVNVLIVKINNLCMHCVRMHELSHFEHY